MTSVTEIALRFLAVVEEPRVSTNGLPAHLVLVGDVSAGRVAIEDLPDDQRASVAATLRWAQAAPPAFKRAGVEFAQRRDREDVARRQAESAALTPVGAERAWRREIALGVRTTTTLDALWRAAATEARGREARAQGLTVAAMRDFAEAARILASLAPGARAA